MIPVMFKIFDYKLMYDLGITLHVVVIIYIVYTFFHFIICTYQISISIITIIRNTCKQHLIISFVQVLIDHRKLKRIKNSKFYKFSNINQVLISIHSRNSVLYWTNTLAICSFYILIYECAQFSKNFHTELNYKIL